jgi:proteasome lid subunit RPN8/RPN11
MIRQVVLSPALRRSIEKEARTALPGECCGLLEGVRRFDAIVVEAAHRTRNLAEGNDRFEIDPADHFRLLHAARKAGREILGCYHSHPNGKAAPSTFDTESAHDDEFVWIIAAVTEETFDLGAFVCQEGTFRKVSMLQVLRD